MCVNDPSAGSPTEILLRLCIFNSSLRHSVLLFTVHNTILKDLLYLKSVTERNSVSRAQMDSSSQMLPFNVIPYLYYKYEINICHSCLFEKLSTITDILPNCCLKIKTFLVKHIEVYLVAPNLVTYLA